MITYMAIAINNCKIATIYSSDVPVLRPKFYPLKLFLWGGFSSKLITGIIIFVCAK